GAVDIAGARQRRIVAKRDLLSRRQGALEAIEIGARIESARARAEQPISDEQHAHRDSAQHPCEILGHLWSSPAPTGAAPTLTKRCATHLQPVYADIMARLSWAEVIFGFTGFTRFTGFTGFNRFTGFRGFTRPDSVLLRGAGMLGVAN